MKIQTDGPYQMYIGGQWVQATNKEVFRVYNPATGELVAEVPQGLKPDATAALEAADGAFPGWSRLSAADRARYLEKIRDLLLENSQEIATVMTMESGKPIREARSEVQSAADNFSWYASEGRRVYGEVVPSDTPNRRIVVIRQPIGVAALITPWNFPLNILSRKLATALAAGCTVVAKPAEQTPLTAILLWRVLEQAGLPAGVTNLITGDPVSIGAELLENPVSKVIGFTGSTAVGKILMEGAAKHVKKLALELGGHAPFLVFEDADIELAVKALVMNKFRNTGQTCSCTNRVYVHESIYARFMDVFSKQVLALHVGNGLEESTEVGPLIDQSGLEKVKYHVQDALSKGAEAVVGGYEINSDGLFFQPTILTNLNADMAIMSEETFGPVLPVVTFRSEEEVIRLANNSPYGLYAFVYTRDIDRCIRVAEALEYGMVGVNESIITVVQAPAGGFKESGLGREGGHWGMDEYLEVKYVALTISQSHP